MHRLANDLAPTQEPKAMVAVAPPPCPRFTPRIPAALVWALSVLFVLGPCEPTARADRSAGLEYVEIVTGGARPGDPLPLVVALHGRGGGIAQLRNELERMPVPVRLVVPRGPIRVDGGRRAWFGERVGQRASADLAATASGTAAELAALIEDLERRRPTCGEAIVVGWSQGGTLAFVLALAHPRLVEHAIVVGGSLPRALTPRHLAPHARVTALHGTADRRVPFGGTRTLTAGLRSLGFAVQLRPYLGVGHELTGPMRKELRAIVRDEAERAASRCAGARR